MLKSGRSFALLTGCLLAQAAIAAPPAGKVHDPSSIVRNTKLSWFFSTGPGIKSFSSSDLTNWSPGPPVFKTFPAWHNEQVPGNNGYLWAPDLIWRDGRYWLYYSVSTFGKNHSAIGLATSPTLDPQDRLYGWKDEGLVIQSKRGNDYNAIDPAIFQGADKRLWMVFGSFWSGIQLVPLDPVTGLLKKDAKPQRIAWSEQIEAPALIQHGKFHYLFVNHGLCCRGVDSTYEIRVGRSKTVTGPYLDKDGREMTTGGGTLFLGTEKPFIGPGHFATIEGYPGTRFSFHYYDGNANGFSKLGIRELEWTEDGWPRAGKWVMPEAK
ncbi:arabinan endo-1,5-alpha-L-arabinosidase [Luteolibacter sp. LG18]|uniref:arabinan endo-1,5-alpha-L-arabinosidase n=1 Tax=Luteolibacter sp. LG18 TaxID=2819286 RepID=UPI002B29DE63|nr:extracellular endo-alpha-(1->5)-L-arabinanase 1 [Luteolibacter sp. LG18]